MISWIAFKLAGLIGKAWLARLNAILDGLLKILAFIFKHWRVFVPLAIVLVSLASVFASRKELADYKAEVLAEKEAARVAATVAHEKAVADEYLAKNQHQISVDTLIRQSKSSIAKEAAKNENLETRISLMRDGLLLTAKRYANAEGGIAEIQLAETHGNATILGCENQKELIERIEVCEEAGALAAADYNYCYDYKDAVVAACVVKLNE